MTPRVGALPGVSPALHRAIADSPRTAEAHAALLAQMPAMEVLEVGGSCPDARLPQAFSVAAWNIERGLDPVAIAAHLAARDPAMVLLSEADNGMARTGQRNVTAEIAEALGMTYAYGVEFYELGRGGPTEIPLCADQTNAKGWHGNAVLSRAPFLDLRLIRLPEPAYWFREDTPANSHEPRVGGRMAVAAIVEAHAGPLCVVSTHLESNAQAPYRAAQVAVLLDAIDAFAPGMPVLWGGDLNAGNRMPEGFDPLQEPLFALSRGRGYGFSASAEGITTQASRISPKGRQMRLDWLATRGLSGTPHPLVPAVGKGEVPLSDHLCLSADVAL